MQRKTKIGLNQHSPVEIHAAPTTSSVTRGAMKNSFSCSIITFRLRETLSMLKPSKVVFSIEGKIVFCGFVSECEQKNCCFRWKINAGKA